LIITAAFAAAQVKITPATDKIPIDINGKPGIAEAVYFVSKAGAQVFNAGSIWWCWGLGKEGYESEPFKRFHENLVLAFLADPKPEKP